MKHTKRPPLGIRTALALVVIASHGAIGLAIELQDVEIQGASGLPDHVVSGLKVIGATAGDSSITLTSRSRTPIGQAAVIVDYYIDCNAGDSSTN